MKDAPDYLRFAQLAVSAAMFVMLWIIHYQINLTFDAVILIAKHLDIP